MDPEPLLQELGALEQAIAAGEDVAMAEVSAVSRRLRDQIGSLQRDDIVRLKAAIDRIHAAALSRRDAIGEALGKVSAGRRAMRGYGAQARPAGVRLFRQA